MTIRQGNGPATGPGATVFFEIDDQVAEKWTLKSVKAPSEVIWEVDFQMFIVVRTLRLKAGSDGETKMTWNDKGNFESPLMRWFTLMPSDSVIQNFKNAMKLLEESAQTELKARKVALGSTTSTTAATE